MYILFKLFILAMVLSIGPETPVNKIANRSVTSANQDAIPVISKA